MAEDGGGRRGVRQGQIEGRAHLDSYHIRRDSIFGRCGTRSFIIRGLLTSNKSALFSKPFGRFPLTNFLKAAAAAIAKVFRIALSYFDVSSETIPIGKVLEVGIFIKTSRSFYASNTIGYNTFGLCETQEIASMFGNFPTLLDGTSSSITFSLGGMTFTVTRKPLIAVEDSDDSVAPSDAEFTSYRFKVTSHNGLFPCFWDETSSEILRKALAQYNSSALFNERSS
jgi:hypothetical protein